VNIYCTFNDVVDRPTVEIARPIELWSISKRTCTFSPVAARRWCWFLCLSGKYSWLVFAVGMSKSMINQTVSRWWNTGKCQPCHWMNSTRSRNYKPPKSCSCTRIQRWGRASVWRAFFEEDKLQSRQVTSHDVIWHYYLSHHITSHHITWQDAMWCDSAPLNHFREYCALHKIKNWLIDWLMTLHYIIITVITSHHITWYFMASSSQSSYHITSDYITYYYYCLLLFFFFKYPRYLESRGLKA